MRHGRDLKQVNSEVWDFPDSPVIILWPPDMKSRLTGKDSGAGKD